MRTIKTRLCNVLDLTIPILQGPMAGAITAQFASTYYER